MWYFVLTARIGPLSCPLLMNALTKKILYLVYCNCWVAWFLCILKAEHRTRKDTLSLGLPLALLVVLLFCFSFFAMILLIDAYGHHNLKNFINTIIIIITITPPPTTTSYVPSPPTQLIYIIFFIRSWRTRALLHSLWLYISGRIDFFSSVWVQNFCFKIASNLILDKCWNKTRYVNNIWL